MYGARTQDCSHGNSWSAGEKTLNLKALFIFISMKLGFLTVCQASTHPCFPQEWLAYHYLHVTRIILLNGEHSRVFSQKKCSYFSKHNQPPDPTTEKAEDASFQTATEQCSIISSSIYGIPECRTIPENTLTVRESDSVMPSGLSIFYSLSLSLITLPGWVG